MGYQPKIRDAGGSVVVTDLASAEEAIKIIVEQGEGEVRDPEHDDPSKKEKDHYEIFTELLADHQSGKRTWELYPTIEDPKALTYLREYNDKRLYQVSFSAST
jgi:hypothetical protein